MASEFWLYLIATLWFIMPAYVANASAPLAKGKMPIDRRKYFGKERLLGDGKTIEGLVFGVILGTLTGFIMTFFYNDIIFLFEGTEITLPYIDIFIGFVISFGALFADIVGSFIKRRIGMRRGEDALLLDQLDFVVGAALFGYFFTYIDWAMIIILIALTPIVHRIANIVGYVLKIKEVPW